MIQRLAFKQIVSMIVFNKSDFIYNRIQNDDISKISKISLFFYTLELYEIIKIGVSIILMVQWTLKILENPSSDTFYNYILTFLECESKTS